MKRIITTCLLLFIFMSMAACSDSKDSAQSAEHVMPATFTETKEESLSIVGNPDAIESISRSVIQIVCYDEFGKEYASGSGFFAFEPGLVVTNFHVIGENVKSAKGIAGETEFSLNWLIDYNEQYDLALLQANPGEIAKKGIEATPLPIGDSSVLRVSEHVTAIGVPLGISKTVSDGIISGFHEDNGIKLIQFTAPISHGSSGGALLNDKGEVIGITSASFSSGQNFNLTVPASYIQLLYNEKGKGQSLSSFYDMRKKLGKDAVVNAFAKLGEITSLRMDMTVFLDMTVQLRYQGTSMSIPIKMTVDYLTDIQKDPSITKMSTEMDIDMGDYGQQATITLTYIDNTGESPVSYSSTDEGISWIVEKSNDKELQPQGISDFLKNSAQEFEKVGVDIVNGKNATMYYGKLDGKYAQEIFGSTGMDELLSDVTGSGDLVTGKTTKPKDTIVIVYVDNTTGYPLYYTMDMTETLKDMLTTAIAAAMGEGSTEGMEVMLDVAIIGIECIFSQFDSVPPIEIPEAALAAHNN